MYLSHRAIIHVFRNIPVQKMSQALPTENHSAWVDEYPLPGWVRYTWNIIISHDKTSEHKYVPLFITTVRFRSQLDDCMQWNFDVGEVHLWQVIKICISIPWLA